MEPAAKRVRLEEPLGISTNLNFNDFSTSIVDIGMDDLASMGEAEPGLVLLSSTSSSKDKTQEEHLEDMMHAWDSLVRTIENLAGSFRTLQRKQSLSTETTEERMGSLESMLEKCSDPEFEEECITVWDAFSFLLSGLEDNGKKLTNAITTIKAQDTIIHEKFKSSEESIQATFSTISRSFQELVNFTKTLIEDQALLSQRILAPSFPNGSFPSGSLSELKGVIQLLMTRVSSIEANAVCLPSSPVKSDTTEEITALKLQLKVLESRIPKYNLLRLRGMTFQSCSEVAVFVENKMPSNSFSMFQDIVTLMERLSGLYVERKEVISEWYQATKVGLDEREARHVASFKITYPTVFGYIKEGSSSLKHHLPAVKSFKDWISFDCESGVTAFILNGMEDLKLQLYQDITSFFLEDKFYDARMLAHDMHNKSQIFVAEMCNWMDVFYQELLTTSEATEEEAWELVSGCIKRFFEDLRRVRASAANATSERNPSTKCATYLWALICFEDSGYPSFPQQPCQTPGGTHSQD